MSVIWFILFIVFLIMWMNVSAELKRSKRREYQEGLSDGYQMAKDQMRSVRGVNNDDAKTIDQFLGVAEPSQEEGSTTANTEVSQESLIINNPTQEDSMVENPVSLVDLQPEDRFIPDPKEVERAKTLQTLKNLNIILYVASFLIVAATAAFVTLTMPAAVKLTGLIVVTILFYAVGLIMHVKTVNLRPAAIAFVGTGLSIVPFIGFALTSLGNMSNEAAWLITSIVGLIAYGVSAVRLQSQLVSYITIAFVLSLALSAASVLSLGVMWYFIFTIVVSLVKNCVYLLAPKLLPSLFMKPLRDTGLVVTPVALVASLFTVTSMSLWMYVVLFTVATAHYLAVWLIQRTYIYELVVRILAHVSGVLLMADIIKPLNKDSVIIFGLVWLGLALLQVAYSLVRIRRDRELADNEQLHIGLAVGLMVLSLPLWYMTEQPSHWVSINLATIGLACFGVAYSLRKIEWVYGTLVVSAVLPFIVGRQIVEPPLSFDVIAGLFVFASLAALFGLERSIANNRSANLKMLFNISSVLFTSLVVICGLLTTDPVAIGWTMALAAGILIAQSYLVKSVASELIGAVLAVVSIAAWTNKLLVASSEWQLVVTVVASVVVLAIGAAVHQYFGQYERRNSLVLLAVTVFSGLIFAVSASSVAVMRTAIILLLVAAIGSVVARSVLTGKDKTLSSAALFAYIVYPLIAMIISFWLDSGWLTLVLLVITGVAWAASYLEQKPSVMVVGHIAIAVGLSTLWSWLDFSEQWMLYGVTWISAAIYYLIYWYAYSKADKERMTISFTFILVVLALASVYALFDTSTQNSLMSAGSLLMVAGVVAIHGYIARRDNYIEASLYVATLSIQWLASVLIPEINMVVYAHWWAVIIFLMAMWRGSYKTRPIVALSFVTASTGLFALTHQGGYSLLFLAEHLVVAIAGAMLRKQWAMWWGIIAVVLAVLYFLRDYTFLALLFLGLLLILFVVWRLVKLGDKK